MSKEYPYWVVQVRTRWEHDKIGDSQAGIWEFYTGDVFPDESEAKAQVELAVKFKRLIRKNTRIVPCRIETPESEVKS